MKKKKKSVFLFKQPVQASLNFLVGSIILGLTCFIIFVSAAPPASPYAPGATLTPDCAQGDPNCTVYAPLATSLTADTAVTMSDYALNFDSGTLYVDALNNRVGIGTTSPYAKLAVAGQIVAEYFTATSTSATSTFASQLLLSRIPDTPHTFASWATGAANSQVQNSSFYINPASAIGDTNLFGAAVSDSVKFLIDAEGDVFANSITLAGGSSLSTTTISTLTVENSANLGDAPNADSHIIKGIVNLYATSSSPVLSIWNSSSGDLLSLSGGATAPENYLTLTSGGNLGLGTSSPYAKLSVSGRGVFDQDVRAEYFTATSTTASSTFPWLVATRSDLGTVIKGTWNGASIADGYIDNNITINGGAISGATNTMSLGSDSTGDIYYRDSSGYLARLAIGTGGYVLGSVSGIPGWVATTTLSTISGTLANTQGGTGQDSSSWDGPISIANGVWTATTSIGVQYGGTGLTAATAGYTLIGNSATALQATSSLFISTAGNVGGGDDQPPV